MCPHRSFALGLLSVCAFFLTPAVASASGTDKTAPDRLRIFVVFNNVPYKTGLETSWGFSCLIEERGKTILFDTGGNGGILLSNMKRLGLDARAMDAVVLSHIHGDHTGGLGAILSRNPGITVYLPESFPASFRQEITRMGARVETVAGPRRLFDKVYSTGEMGGTIKEQALIVDTPLGLVVITGCAHPNVADMAQRAQTYLGKNVYLLMGGFHLGGKSDAEIRTVIERLKAVGVRKVAPSHCTGDSAIHLFREEWKANFLEGGLGSVIEVPLT